MDIHQSHVSNLATIQEESEWEEAAESDQIPEESDEREMPGGEREEDVEGVVPPKGRRLSRLFLDSSQNVQCGRSHLEHASLHDFEFDDNSRASLSSTKASTRTRKRRKENVRTSRRRKTMTFNDFPQWLRDLMVNIEEAKTHRLVIE